MKKWFWIVLLLSLCAGPALAQDAGKGNPTVVIKTNKGVIEAVLYKDKAPITVENFMKYVDAGFYNGTIFHRVIPDFMIQGGGFNRYFTQKPTQPPIKNEAANGLKNERGTLAMARTSVVDSATAQFFINLKNNDMLNHGPVITDTPSSARSPRAWTWLTPSPACRPGRRVRSIRTSRAAPCSSNRSG